MEIARFIHDSVPRRSHPGHPQGRQFTDLRREAILADNGSTDATAAWAREAGLRRTENARALLGLGLAAEGRGVPAALDYRAVLSRVPEDSDAARGLARVDGGNGLGACPVCAPRGYGANRRASRAPCRASAAEALGRCTFW
jgi:hypothetical protein